MAPTRRTVLCGALVVVSGCMSDGPLNEQPDDTSSPRTRDTRDGSANTSRPSYGDNRNPTGTRESTAETTTQEHDAPTPDETIGYGESYVDTALEITVEKPRVRTSFRHDGNAYEMPGQNALVLASIAFENTHSEDARPADGPLFTLVAGDGSVLETNDIHHPDAEAPVPTDELSGISTTSRWSSHGISLSPGETRAGTAVFISNEDTRVPTTEIIYESSRVRDDRFGETVVAWSQ